jgi:hypothetical protein
MIRSRLPRIFLAPTTVIGSYATPHPTMSTSTGRGAMAVHLGPPPAFSPAQLQGHEIFFYHDTMSGYGLAASSTATACHHHHDYYANTRTERKARNREHLRAFSFYFRTSKCCNPTPPFAYYKRGGRDPRQRKWRHSKMIPCNGNVLNTHTNTRTPPRTETWEPSLSRPACIPLLQALRCKAT